jgi:hypothetical protein
VDKRAEAEKRSSDQALQGQVRRRLLRNALRLGAAALGLKALEATGISQAAAVIAAEEQPPQHKPPEAASAAPNETHLNGFRVFFDGEEMPTHYITPGGEEVRLDRKKLLEAKRNAIQNKEIEFVKILPAEAKIDEPPSPSLEHPVLSEKPTNALSEEQLEKRGIKIVQSPHVEFFLRAPAFEEGGVFETFTEGGPRKLKIVLVDGPVAAAPFIQDKRYDEVRPYLEDRTYLNKDDFLSPEFAQEFKKKQENLLASLRKQLEQAASNPEYTRSMIQAAKETLYKLDNLGEEDLLKFLAEKTTSRSGLYIPPYDPEKPHYFKYPEKSRQEPGTAVLFIAAGESVQPVEEVKMFFDENGKFQIKSEANPYRRSFLPTEKDSMPDPGRYKPDIEANPMDPNSYPYGAQDVIAVIYHEGEHDAMIGAAVHKGEIPDTSEYQTDIRFIQRLHSVRRRWVDSGFTDDSLSAFGFRLRNGRFIIFRRNTSDRTAA